MTPLALQPDHAEPAGAAAARQIRRVASQAWAEMARHGVLPTPRNFALWFASLDGTAPTPRPPADSVPEGAVEALPEGEGPAALDLERVLESTEEFQAAAQQCLGHVATNEAALRDYGHSLAHWAAQLDKQRTVDGLGRAIAALADTTAKASERNRVLERQLHASAARIARLKHSLAETKQRAATDALTGLCNRKAFDLRLRQAAGRARTTGTAVALLLLDIDHFKRFNDAHGHPAGDLVLRLVGRLLLANVKGRDTAARYGGEEFAVILDGANLEAAARVAGQLRAELEGKRLVQRRLGEEAGGVTMSVGAAALRPGEGVAELIARADAALYRAKRLGRNRVCLEEDAGDAQRERRTA